MNENNHLQAHSWKGKENTESFCIYHSKQNVPHLEDWIDDVMGFVPVDVANVGRMTRLIRRMEEDMYVPWSIPYAYRRVAAYYGLHWQSLREIQREVMQKSQYVPLVARAGKSTFCAVKTIAKPLTRHEGATGYIVGKEVKTIHNVEEKTKMLEFTNGKNLLVYMSREQIQQRFMDGNLFAAVWRDRQFRE